MKNFWWINLGNIYSSTQGYFDDILGVNNSVFYLVNNLENYENPEENSKRLSNGLPQHCAGNFGKTWWGRSLKGLPEKNITRSFSKHQEAFMMELIKKF